MVTVDLNNKERINEILKKANKTYQNYSGKEIEFPDIFEKIDSYKSIEEFVKNNKEEVKIFCNNKFTKVLSQESGLDEFKKFYYELVDLLPFQNVEENIDIILENIIIPYFEATEKNVKNFLDNILRKKGVFKNVKELKELMISYEEYKRENKDIDEIINKNINNVELNNLEKFYKLVIKYFEESK